MTGHKRHLVENGTMLSCDASGCQTQGRPFLLAGGDVEICPDGYEDKDPIKNWKYEKVVVAINRKNPTS